MIGILYGIGVGPGASDLLTLRAVRLLSTLSVVLTPVRRGSESSRALAIARPYLPKDCEEVPLDFPMTREKEVLARAWDEAASQCLAVLQTGKHAAFLTLGDPGTYSTFTYLMRAVKARAPKTPISIVPGITSYQAASAKLEKALCEGKSNLHILSGLGSCDELVRELRHAETAVVLKAYRNFPAIREALQKTDRLETVWQVSSVEQEGECLHKGLQASGVPPYMTLLLSFPPDS